MNNDTPISLIKSIDHVSLTVHNLEAVVEFYTRVFNASVLYRMGPMDFGQLEDGSDWSEEFINVPGACITIVMLQLTEGLKLELFEYSKPESGITTPPKNCDVGSRHLCFEVSEIEEAVNVLEANGCKAMRGPIEIIDGPCPPSKSWYVLDPFNHQLELVQYL